jgi:hypothetical protein
MATIQGFANKNGEYQRKPMIIEAPPAPSTANN